MGFRDRSSDFDGLNVAVFGVSFDSPDENRAFREKFDFPFGLLCDTDKSLSVAYGAAADGSAGYPNRITVVVGPDGKVAKVYDKVDPKQHPEQVLTDCRQGFGG